MFLDDENATSVAKEGTSPEPAKTEENVTAIAAPGELAGAAAAAAEETPVSRQIVTLTAEVTDAIRTLVQAKLASEIALYLHEHPPVTYEQIRETAQESVQAEVATAVEQAKADIIAHLMPLVGAIVEGKTPPALAARQTSPLAAVHNFQAGDPVKVWGDPEHKTFRLGKIVAIHDGGHAFDVELDDGTVTKIGADGLEYDDRK